ncbi:MAG: flagellar hook assembly protein FlgD, partial [Planctomycetota bacterium]
MAVFIEDTRGRIVRHLAAGALGKNAPKPFRPGLAQSLEWDGRADYGKEAGPGPFKVRVALGLGAKYDKVVISDPGTIESVSGLAVGPDGTVYAMVSCGGTSKHWTGRQMLAFNRDGSYQRMVMPWPSGLKRERVEGFGVFELDGRPAPLIHDVKGHSFYPAITGRKAGVAVLPSGVILTLTGQANSRPWKTRPVNSIGAVDSKGGAPWGGYCGPSLPGSFAERSFITVSSDSQWAYFDGLAGREGAKRGKGKNRPDDKNAKGANKAKKKGVGKAKKAAASPAVYRAKLPARGPAEPFFGRPAEAGSEQAHLSDSPRGLAVDGKGHLLIADQGNNRVVAVAERGGGFAGSFAVAKPDCLAVDPKDGAVYLTRLTGGGRIELVKYSGWKDARELIKLSVPKDGDPSRPWLMALDAGARPPLVWLGGDGGRLLRVEERDGKFVAREVSNHNAGNAAFLDVSVDR